MKKFFVLLTAVLLVLSLTVTAFAEGEDPPPVVEEEAPPVDGEVPPVDEEEPEMDMLMMSSSVGPHPDDVDPEDLGLPPQDSHPGGYQAMCGMVGYPPCVKVDGVQEADSVNQVGVGETYEATASVVVIFAGGKSFFFTKDSEILCTNTYCVTWNDNGTITVVRLGTGPVVKDISNIQFWLTGETPPPPPPPPPPPNGDDDDDDDDPGLVIRVDVATGGTSPAVFLWLATAISGLAIPFVGKKKN